MWHARYYYLMLLPVIGFFGLFRYGPMYGLLLAFKKFNARLGILGSEWVGMKHFQRIFITPDSVTALTNTIVISFSRLLFQFWVPIALAILLNEMRGRKVKRLYQVVLTFPHFMSWVIVATVMVNLLGTNGALNEMIASLGGKRIGFLAKPEYFRTILYTTANWKNMGWSAIIYIAAITSINPELYEAAIVDGAGRLRRIWHITLPGIRPTIVIMLILAIGGIMDAGFEQIFNLQNPSVRQTADIIDTYIYRITFEARPDYGFSTAVGLFKSVVNLLLLLSANILAKRIQGSGLFV